MSGSDDWEYSLRPEFCRKLMLSSEEPKPVDGSRDVPQLDRAFTDEAEPADGDVEFFGELIFEPQQALEGRNSGLQELGDSQAIQTADDPEDTIAAQTSGSAHSAAFNSSRSSIVNCVMPQDVRALIVLSSHTVDVTYSADDGFMQPSGQAMDIGVDQAMGSADSNAAGVNQGVRRGVAWSADQNEMSPIPLLRNFSETGWSGRGGELVHALRGSRADWAGIGGGGQIAGGGSEASGDLISSKNRGGTASTGRGGSAVARKRKKPADNAAVDQRTSVLASYMNSSDDDSSNKVAKLVD